LDDLLFARRRFGYRAGPRIPPHQQSGSGKTALRVIFTALERVQEFPNLGRPTEDAGIRQLVVRFGAAGYIVRYTTLHDSGDVLVLRLWHGREART
jgi:plasmid stabilization system protein ParE